MNQNIQQVVKPENFGGLNRHVPEPAIDTQALLATVAEEDKVWDTIERNLFR